MFGERTWDELCRLLLPEPGHADPEPRSFPALERFCEVRSVLHNNTAWAALLWAAAVCRQDRPLLLPRANAAAPHSLLPACLPVCRPQTWRESSSCFCP